MQLFQLQKLKYIHLFIYKEAIQYFTYSICKNSIKKLYILLLKTVNYFDCKVLLSLLYLAHYKFDQNWVCKIGYDD